MYYTACVRLYLLERLLHGCVGKRQRKKIVKTQLRICAASSGRKSAWSSDKGCISLQVGKQSKLHAQVLVLKETVAAPASPPDL